MLGQQAITAAGYETSDAITGAFLVMIVGPFIGTVWEKYQELTSRRDGDKDPR